jgi:hypothetical protein
VKKNPANSLNVLGYCNAFYADPIELSEIRPLLVYAGIQEAGNWKIEGVCTDYDQAK